MTNIMSTGYNKHDGIATAEHLDNGIQQTDLRLTLTVPEMAKQLNISRATAYNLASQPDFYPSFRIGGRVLVSSSALASWIQKQTGG